MSLLGWLTGRRRAVVSVVHLRGLISAGRLGGVSLERSERALEAAFRGLWRAPDAVAVNVNSPGGSAVQSAMLYRRIRELAQGSGVPVLTFAGGWAPRLASAARPLRSRCASALRARCRHAARVARRAAPRATVASARAAAGCIAARVC
jgi:hypothetical protein